MAVGKLFHRFKYLRMQAKISSGNDYLRFPQVIGRNLSASAINLHESFIVRVRVESNLGMFFFLSSVNHFD